MSPGVLRARTTRVALHRRTQLGPHHAGTWAAYARLHVAWNGWRGMPDGRAPEQPVDDYAGHWARAARAYTRADLRARGLAGFENRHERKRALRRARSIDHG